MQNIDAVFAVKQNVIDHLFALSSDERINFILGNNPRDEKEFLSNLVDMRELNSLGNVIVTFSNEILGDSHGSMKQIEVVGEKDGLWVISPEQSKELFFKLITHSKEQFKYFYDQSALKYKYCFNELWIVWNYFRDVCYASVKHNTYTLVRGVGE